MELEKELTDTREEKEKVTGKGKKWTWKHALKSILVGSLLLAGSKQYFNYYYPRTTIIKGYDELKPKHVVKLAKSGFRDLIVHGDGRRCLKIDADTQYCGHMDSFVMTHHVAEAALRHAIKAKSTLHKDPGGGRDLLASSDGPLLVRGTGHFSREYASMLTGTHGCRSTAFVANASHYNRVWRRDYAKEGIALLFDLRAMQSIAPEAIRFAYSGHDSHSGNMMSATCMSSYEHKRDQSPFLRYITEGRWKEAVRFYEMLPSPLGEVIADLDARFLLGLAVYPSPGKGKQETKRVLARVAQVAEDSAEVLRSVTGPSDKMGDLERIATALSTVYVYDFSLETPQLVRATDRKHLRRLLKRSFEAVE
jgi:hypothetical protein